MLINVLLAALAVQLVNALLFVWLRRRLVLRNLALRQQLAVYKRRAEKPKLKDRDRLFWSILSRLLPNWKSCLTIVTPETVLRWRRKKLREFLRRMARSKPGHPRIPREHIALIKRISRDHPGCSGKRTARELMENFGVEHAPSTIDRYRVKPKGDPGSSQKWRTFLGNNIDGIWSCDFFVQYTVGFRALHVLVIMELESRNVVHFGVTENPTLEWTKQQIRNAGLEHELPRYLIHDNDGRFGQFGTSRTVTDGAGESYSCRSSLAAWLWETMGVKSVPTPYGAPNANAHCERLIGTTRRECLDHLLIWNARHLHRVLTEFYGWYREARPHLGINGIPEPDPALAEPRPALGEGKVVARPILGGLHHDYGPDRKILDHYSSYS